ncbi:RagB/SusD family nutrient uptake outer membrane protein [Sphingobacterium sp. DN00404]|uniref:RagB/SusD family nutrient uptake outer membrane protein n=1 Tax=Sphingobacterium micropteri TaxID=2763501 RepID=A0ABR7YNR6_9SPHI|nr:RagB/SusD family nutrient uptake outer membrane protein [Sphingobacterium micropteri]MBD1432942.1 RagB/SusD family nutrient uptake outer membrane protein [Sphingobacterium micropteri]
MKNIMRYYGMAAILFLQWGCAAFLEEKPDKSLALADGLKELQAILDYEVGMNQNYPAAGDIASPYFYLTEADWSARTEITREIYSWNEKADNSQDWHNAYTRIFYANVVLDQIDDVALKGEREQDRTAIKGSALFFRGWNFFQLSQIYTPPYMEDGDGQWGIPLRLGADINIVTERSTISETFNQIVSDLTYASQTLPEQTVVPNRPSRAAAYAALSIVYLSLDDFLTAEKYADSCLMLQSDLIDYNFVDGSMVNPFPIFNEEVIFHATMFGTAQVFYRNRAKITEELFDTHDETDLRRTVFYSEQADGSFTFKGDYSGSSTSGLPFCGIATDEMYLIKAECAARLEKNEVALKYLNEFMLMRYDSAIFEAFDSNDALEILDKTISERKKQLAFRGGVSWRDLRRLNREERYRQTLVREIGGDRYTLGPNDKRYAFLIPVSVVQMSGIQQNER